MQKSLRSLGRGRTSKNPLPVTGAAADRRPATVRRAARFGMANQMAHEQAGRRQRTEALFGMTKRREERRAAGAAATTNRKDDLMRKETGANAGTFGRSRSRRGPLIQAFMGKGRGRYA